MIGHTDKSVRDNPQRATIRDDIITVTNRYRRRKVFEYSLHIDEWYEAGRTSGNLDYGRFQLVKQEFMKLYKGDYLSEACFVDRLVWSEFYAIKKVVKEYENKSS